MTQVQWQKVFETNIEEVDEQHKKLVAMINQLEDSLRRGMGIVNKEEGKVLTALVEYTQYHFEDEERIMRDIGYQGLQEHHALHEDLKRKIVSLLKRLKVGESVNVFELMSFLTDWLLNHIIKEDLKIGQAYKAAHAEPQLKQ